MISPISSISGYSVQAIYGNPVSTKAVNRVGENTTANRAMMTVSKNRENEIQSQTPAKEDTQEATKKDPLKSVAAGKEAELVKQLSQLARAIGKQGRGEREEESEDEIGTLSSSLQQNPFASQLSNQYENVLVEMGYQQNIRDKVSSSYAQSQLAEATQRAIEPQEAFSQVTNTQKAGDAFGNALQ